jgi:ATP-dependent DNA helicase RecQ
MPGAVTIDLEGALARFGLRQFRPGQHEVISSILAGHDCLCVMPTGGGKSLCYQLPAIVRPGLTIVVSPLIALMKDQVDALQRRGISATLINSTLTGAEQNERLQQVAEGSFALVYVAPERLRNPRFLDAIRATPIQLLAIDEAHCISEWGHDFRPDYARIGRFREWLGGVQTVALTATATPRVRSDIESILRLRNPKHFITGFARTNLHFAALTCPNDREKDRLILDFLRTKPGSGIIYAATRKRCEELTETLARELKIRVGAYHAGLDLQQRRFIQEQFMKGLLDVIIATNAFGMGIDKANLRYVIHYNMPGSLEAYYQEAGRAGRDGQPSQCMLLYSSQDRYIQEFFIENAYPPKDCIQKIYEFLTHRTEDPIELTHEEIREALDLPITNESVGTALQILARTGAFERLDAGGGLAMIRLSSDLPTLVDLLPKESKRRRKVLRVLEQAVGDRRYDAVYLHPRWLMQKTELDRDALQQTLRDLNKLDAVDYVPPFRGRAIHFQKRGIPFEALEIDFATLEERKKADYEKLDQVIAFAQAGRCRQLSILQYFGDPAARACGLCDRCTRSAGWFSLASETSIPTPPPSTAPSQTRASPSPSPIQPSPTQANATPLNQSQDVRPATPKPPRPAKPPSVLTDQARRAMDASLRRTLQAVQRLHGRLGKRLIAQFLCGSEDAKVQRLKLNRLPEFGSLQGFTQTETVQVLDALLTVGLLEQHEVTAHRPTVSISEIGREVLEGQRPFPDFLPLHEKLIQKLSGPSSTPSRSAPANSDPANSDPANSDPANSDPANSDPGPLKNILKNTPHEPVRASPKVSVPTAQPTPVPTPKLVASTPPDESAEDWRWTARLVEDGYTWAECAAIRRKPPDAILRDLASALRSGREFALQAWLDQRTWLVLRGIVQELQGGGQRSPLSQTALERLPSLLPLAQAMRDGQVPA